MFRGSVKSTGYSLHLSVSPSLSLPCITVRHHILTGLYYAMLVDKQFASSSSSGPGAYAPDAPQPVGLLCYPRTILVF